MYDFNGFGKRLQKLRKAKGLTQEELADRMGVSGQAVSKWENDLSYPDITIIPALAEVLGTDIDHIFGKKNTHGTVPYPDTFEGMPLVHSTEEVACYSNKVVASIDTSGIKFSDGSIAELSNRLAVNNGAGEIRFIGREDIGGSNWQHWDSSETTKDFEFGTTDSVDIMVLFNECCIVRSPDDKTRVKAKGDAKFIHRLKAEMNDKMLKIDFLQQDGPNNNNGSYKGNQVIVEVPYERGNFAVIRINGSGMLNSEATHFNKGELSVNGSGGICMKDFNSCSAAINGSGSITAKNADELTFFINGSGNAQWDNVKNAKATINGSGVIELTKSVEALNAGINGSGVITANEVTSGDVLIKVSGSGNVDIHGGNCNKFDANISGNADINASALTAKTAHIVLHEDGNVTLGRVLEGSTEQIKKKGTIKILKRGAGN